MVDITLRVNGTVLTVPNGFSFQNSDGSGTTPTTQAPSVGGNTGSNTPTTQAPTSGGNSGGGTSPTTQAPSVGGNTGSNTPTTQAPTSGGNSGGGTSPTTQAPASGGNSERASRPTVSNESADLGNGLSGRKIEGINVGAASNCSTNPCSTTKL